MQNRDVQYKHAVRKKESEIARLKERLHALLVDSKTETRIGKYKRDDYLKAAYTGCGIENNPLKKLNISYYIT